MGVGEDDRRWTIRVCEPCGELVTWCRCEWLPRRPEPPSVDVDVVPASVVVGLRGEVERLRRGVSDLALDVAYAEVVEKPEAEVEIARLSEEVERLRTALASALASCEEAADGVCDCDGYYRCNTCPGRIARDAERAVEVLRAALAPVVFGEQEDNR